MALDPIGRVLGGRYRATRLLGAGGMGAVYEGLQLDLGRRVAIKVLHASSPDGAGVERFRREARAAAALGHPNIIQVTDFQVNPGEPPFMVMELLEGTSLGALIDKTGPLPIGRVVFIMMQALAGIDAAHRAGIVHRDIKPDNVFLSSTTVMQDQVKVLDFGIAQLASDAGRLTTPGQVIGSPAYMAPEQAGGRTIDACTDIYAVGVCMVHALAGGLLTGMSPTQRLASARNDLPPAFVALVERATAYDPQQRFASAEDMRAALAPWGNAAAGASVIPAAPAISNLPPALAPSPYSATHHAAPPMPPPVPRPAAAPSAGLIAAIALVGVGLLGLAGAGFYYLLYARVAAVPPLPPLQVAASATSSSAVASAAPAATGSAPLPPGSPRHDVATKDAGAAKKKATIALLLGDGALFNFADEQVVRHELGTRMGKLNACYDGTPVPDNRFYATFTLDSATGAVRLVLTRTPSVALQKCVDESFNGLKLGHTINGTSSASATFRTD